VPGPLRSNELGFFLWDMMIYFLSGLALLLIILAAFNYTSLSVARSLMRAKEVGVRKTIGATRGRIITQFLLEAVLVSLFSLVISVVILQFLLPGFSGMKMMSILEIRPQQNYTYFLFIVLAILSDYRGYAGFISTFNPYQVLKVFLISSIQQNNPQEDPACYTICLFHDFHHYNHFAVQANELYGKCQYGF
jgi:putative ABC transport system permease protein